MKHLKAKKVKEKEEINKKLGRGRYPYNCENEDVKTKIDCKCAFKNRVEGGKPIKI